MKNALSNFSEKHPIIWQGLVVFTITLFMAALVYFSFVFDAWLNELLEL